LISGEKDWKRVSMQKVVTLNTCCDVACPIFKLPHDTTYTLFRTINVSRETQMNEFCISQGSAVTFVGCDRQVHNHGYSSFYFVEK